MDIDTSSGTTVFKGIERDPEYDWVAQLPPPPMPGSFVVGKKGRQCGECGIKFEYDKVYGFCCGNQRCPCGWNR